MTKIKICGLKRQEDIDLINRFRPDYCGFIINYPRSHRNLTPEQVMELSSGLDSAVCPVGVFVDSPPELVKDLLLSNTISIAQLHGNESEEYILRLKAATGAEIIKAFTINDRQDLERAEASPADYILLDKGRGDGVAFDWSLLDGVNRPYFLAGGLNPDNLEAALNQLRPYAVDLSSGVETDRYKDPQKVERIMELINNYNRLSD